MKILVDYDISSFHQEIMIDLKLLPFFRIRISVDLGLNLGLNNSY